MDEALRIQRQYVLIANRTKEMLILHGDSVDNQVYSMWSRAYLAAANEARTAVRKAHY